MIPPRVALQYDDDAYVEAPAVGAAQPTGLMGRRVAGNAFLDAYLQFGSWTELVALVRDRGRAAGLIERFRGFSGRGERRLRLIEESEFFTQLADRPWRVVHQPEPLDGRLAWARRTIGGDSFSFSGVTHTLSTLPALERLRELLIAPFEPWDTLICTSRAVEKLVRAALDSYAGYLAERHGGKPQTRVRLEVIPLGVDPSIYRPATSAERSESREALRIDADEVAVLFVGRLSHHAKAHPFPLYRAAARASEETRRKVHLVLSGWAAHPAIKDAFVNGAREFARGVRVTFVDGNDPAHRVAVWRAADVFASLADSIQETFGLVIVEAMACGLPVIASDWNGYRDLVVDGETGFLVPTIMVRDALSDALDRLFLGRADYDHFLAECGQTVTVEAPAAAEALARLVQDAPLREAMGAAGRERARKLFTWEGVVQSYERLWREQEELRSRHAGSRSTAPASINLPLDALFQSYPSAWIDGSSRLIASESARERLDALLNSALTNHVPETRIADRDILIRILDRARTAVRLDEIEAALHDRGLASTRVRATVAWLLKYDLLRRL